MLIGLHEGADDASLVTAKISFIPGVQHCAVVEGSKHTAVIAHKSMLSEIEKVDEVKVTSIRLSKALFNDNARVIVGLDASPGQLPPGRPIYDDSGQIITVADSGLDLGDPNNKQPAFQHFNVRIPGHSWSMADHFGHGTHVAASAVGSGFSQVTGSRIPVKGTAPGADLLVQLIIKWNGITDPPPGDALIYFFLQPSYNAGSRIHSNSWGSIWDPNVGQLTYEDEGQANVVDKFVFENPDFVIVVAAGNFQGRLGPNGLPSPSQIGGIGSSKNYITVGASQSSRQAGIYQPFMEREIDTYAPCWFSNMGPTYEGRIKPDIVAPGSSILSTRTRFFGSNSTLNSPELDWELKTGTSCATSLVAGCVAVVRQALLAEDPDFRGLIPLRRPSAVLIKALLLHYASDMKGDRLMCNNNGPPHQVSYPVTPNRAYGYGRVNVEHVLSAISERNPLTDRVKPTCGYEDVERLMLRDQTHEFSINPPIAGLMIIRQKLFLKITFVYLDPPDPWIQNHLRLKVYSSHYGPRAVAQDPGQSWENVQQVILEVPIPKRPARWVMTQVQAEEIFEEKKQKFAIVWSWHAKWP